MREAAGGAVEESSDGDGEVGTGVAEDVDEDVPRSNTALEHLNNVKDSSCTRVARKEFLLKAIFK